MTHAAAFPLLPTLLAARARAGSVCLDVINQTWSPMFGAPSSAPCPRLPDLSCAFCWVSRQRDITTWRADLVNVFEVFLPQLLLYPNPTDPLNGEAAALLMREPETYKKKVRGASHRTFPVTVPSQHAAVSFWLASAQ